MRYREILRTLVVSQGIDIGMSAEIIQCCVEALDHTVIDYHNIPPFSRRQMFNVWKLRGQINEKSDGPALGYPVLLREMSRSTEEKLRIVDIKGKEAHFIIFVTPTADKLIGILYFPTEEVQEFVRKQNIKEEAYQLAERLHKSELSIIEAIKTIRSECGLSLGDAKQIITRHPAWKNKVVASNALHDELESALIEIMNDEAGEASGITEIVAKEYSSKRTITMPTPTGFLHLVYFYPAEGAGADAAEKLAEGCKKYLPGIPGVRRLEVGFPAGTPREVVDNSYIVALLVEYADVAAHDVYQDHPDHLRFIAENRVYWSRVQVYDSLIF